MTEIDAFIEANRTLTFLKLLEGVACVPLLMVLVMLVSGWLDELKSFLD